jgi:RimJ/RimL family protein N-acetyltransferase
MGIDNPLLFDFSDSFETERLLIRAPRPGDGQTVNEAIAESYDNLHPWVPWAKTLPTLKENEEFMRRSAARFLQREDLGFLLFRKSDGLFVGGTGLHRMDWSVPRFEIGYWIRSSLEGQGYITEAVKGLTHFTFETLRAERIEIRCDSNNERSAAVARRCGYVLEGQLRRDGRKPDGNLRDTLLFSMIRAEWETQRDNTR